jgi:hypothetical protein
MLIMGELILLLAKLLRLSVVIFLVSFEESDID